MPIESWFPVPIFYERVPEARAIIDETLPHLYRISEGRRKHQPLVTGAAYTGSNAPDRAQYLFKFPELRPLYEMINVRANTYAKELGIDLDREHIYMGRSWVNILGKGGKIESHTHVAATFSGAFYLKLPDPAGVLRFIDPKQPIRRDPHYAATPTLFNTGHVDYPVAEGLLLLFPGYAMHGMLDENPSDTDRVSLSFDYFSISLNGQSPPPPPKNLVDRLWKEIDEAG
ncbi:hypothetical protein LBMAG42_35230 [Deltaproteobacteria bacterium]|nr:hypothetical protein LBMAG42_35230 [Deltaproteobacteria bacterium]